MEQPADTSTGAPRRTTSRVMAAVIAIILLVAGFYLVENWRGKHAWNEHRKMWEAKGEKFHVQQLAPPPVPDSQNFTMTPLLAPVLSYTQTTEGVKWGDTNGTARLRGISATLADPHRPSSTTRPPGGATKNLDPEVLMGKLEIGSFADLSSTAEFYRGNTNYAQADASASDAQIILAALSTFDAELAELQQAAASRPFSRFPVRYETEPGWAILLPHLSHVKQLTQVTQLRAVARLEAGDAEGALQDLRLGLRLSGSVAQEPLLIDHLVRIATLQMCLQTVREGLLRQAWNQKQLGEMETMLGRLNILSEYCHAMRGERALSTEGIDFLRRERFGSRQFEEVFGTDGPPLVLARFVPAGWFYQNMLTTSRMHQDYFLPAVDPEKKRVSVEISDQGEKAIERLPKNPYTILARMTLPALTRAVQRSAITQTYVDATRVACAVERFRLVKGSYPDNLEALVPEFLANVPTDVIDGKPLRFRKTEQGGYAIYSVGWNHTDDGGTIAFRSTDRSKRSIDHLEGDWVFLMSTTNEPTADQRE